MIFFSQPSFLGSEANYIKKVMNRFKFQEMVYLLKIVMNGLKKIQEQKKHF